MPDDKGLHQKQCQATDCSPKTSYSPAAHGINPNKPLDQSKAAPYILTLVPCLYQLDERSS